MPREKFFDLKFSHWVQIILTLALVGIAYLQWAVYSRQANIMDAQARISDHQRTDSEAAQRAFVSAEWSLERSYIIDTSNNSRAAGWRFGPILSNHGVSTAENLSEYGEFYVCDPDMAMSKHATPPSMPGGPMTLSFKTPLISAYGGTVTDWSMTPHECTIDAELILGAADPQAALSDKAKAAQVRHYPIAPGQKTPVLNSLTFPENYLRPMIERGGRIYVFGIVTYDDVFKSRAHITYYCYGSERDFDALGHFELGFVPCIHWNCTDSDCDQDQKAAREDAIAYAKREGLALPPRLATPN